MHDQTLETGKIALEDYAPVLRVRGNRIVVEDFSALPPIPRPLQPARSVIQARRCGTSLSAHPVLCKRGDTCG